MNTIFQIVLAVSLIVQPLATALDIDSISSALVQQEVKIPVQIHPLPDASNQDDFFLDDDLTQDDYLLEDLYPSEKVRIHYHYHFEDDIALKSGCDDNDDYDDDETVDCGTFLLSPPRETQTGSPSEEPSTSSLVPTAVPSRTMSPAMYPSASFASSTPSQGGELESSEPSSIPSIEPSSQTATNAPSSFVSHDPTSLEKEINAYSATDSKSSLAIGTSYWVAGVAICIVAFVGGFVSSRFVSRKQGSTGGSTDWSNVSVQLSVEESVDSYHNHDCEDWSVSVISWTPAAATNDQGFEVQTKLRSNRKGARATDEIEIEFQERDLEGYGNDYYEDEEDPRLFDVIDLASQSSI